MGKLEKKEQHRQRILSCLADSGVILNSIQITEQLRENDYDLSERSVRLYLNQLDEEGLTLSYGKRGRSITEKGRNELKCVQLMDRVGYMSTVIDRMTFSMDFDLSLRRGTVVINTAIVEKDPFRSRLNDIIKVFEHGYGMGNLVALLQPGEQSGNLVVPEGCIGFCTVCSITLNGVLLKHGIPTRSLFGGLLDLEKGEPVRFAELINYEATSIDPLQLFIRSRLTNYLGAIKNGNGRIGAGFREIPEESYPLVLSLSEKLNNIGLGAFLTIGRPSQELLNIPVRQGSCGIIVIGGLNPVAILEETRVEVQHCALSGLMEYNDMFHYSELKERLE